MRIDPSLVRELSPGEMRTVNGGQDQAALIVPPTSLTVRIAVAIVRLFS